MTTQAESHPVYPDGPLCQPNCPGPWSMYHDGYADGYENAEYALAATPPTEGLTEDQELDDMEAREPGNFI